MIIFRCLFAKLFAQIFGLKIFAQIFGLKDICANFVTNIQGFMRHHPTWPEWPHCSLIVYRHIEEEHASREKKLSTYIFLGCLSIAAWQIHFWCLEYQVSSFSLSPKHIPLCVHDANSIKISLWLDLHRGENYGSKLEGHHSVFRKQMKTITRTKSTSVSWKQYF